MFLFLFLFLLLLLAYDRSSQHRFFFSKLLDINEKNCSQQMFCSLISIVVFVGIAVIFTASLGKAPHHSFGCHFLKIGCPKYPSSGYVHPFYESVRLVFEQLYANGLEQGSQLVVYADGEKVIDLVGGFRDDASPMKQTDLSVIFSSTKGI
jgi:hypothetical protein